MARRNSAIRWETLTLEEAKVKLARLRLGRRVNEMLDVMENMKGAKFYGKSFDSQGQVSAYVRAWKKALEVLGLDWVVTSSVLYVYGYERGSEYDTLSEYKYEAHRKQTGNA